MISDNHKANRPMGFMLALSWDSRDHLPGMDARCHPESDAGDDSRTMDEQLNADQHRSELARSKKMRRANRFRFALK